MCKAIEWIVSTVPERVTVVTGAWDGHGIGMGMPRCKCKCKCAPHPPLACRSTGSPRCVQARSVVVVQVVPLTSNGRRRDEPLGGGPCKIAQRNATRAENNARPVACSSQAFVSLRRSPHLDLLPVLARPFSTYHLPVTSDPFSSSFSSSPNSPDSSEHRPDCACPPRQPSPSLFKSPVLFAPLPSNPESSLPAALDAVVINCRFLQFALPRARHLSNCTPPPTPVRDINNELLDHIILPRSSRPQLAQLGQLRRSRAARVSILVIPDRRVLEWSAWSSKITAIVVQLYMLCLS